MFTIIKIHHALCMVPGLNHSNNPKKPITTYMNLSKYIIDDRRLIST